MARLCILDDTIGGNDYFANTNQYIIMRLKEDHIEKGDKQMVKNFLMALGLYCLNKE